MTARQKRSTVDQINERLTIGTVAAGATILAVIAGGFWTACTVFQTKTEAAAHAKADDQRQAWTSFGFADARVQLIDIRGQFLADHVFECDTRKAQHASLDPVDAATCARYQSQYTQAQTQLNQMTQTAAELKKSAGESGK